MSDYAVVINQFVAITELGLVVDFITYQVQASSTYEYIHTTHSLPFTYGILYTSLNALNLLSDPHDDQLDSVIAVLVDQDLVLARRRLRSRERARSTEGERAISGLPYQPYMQMLISWSADVPFPRLYFSHKGGTHKDELRTFRHLRPAREQLGRPIDRTGSLARRQRITPTFHRFEGVSSRSTRSVPFTYYHKTPHDIKSVLLSVTKIKSIVLRISLYCMIHASASAVDREKASPVEVK
jgi:hypothetical protein